jgi:hypothetical protein
VAPCVSNSRPLIIFKNSHATSFLKQGVNHTIPHYLHHTTGSNIVVRTDHSFPVQFLKSVKSAMGKWNTSLGWNVYMLGPVEDSLDLLDCLSTNSLCLRWEGPIGNVGWIGWGGITGLNFDPQTGEIQGAVITLQNLTPANLQPTPAAILAQISKSFNLDLVVDFLFRKEEFKQYIHPFPEEVIEYVLLHEIGHANGLRHDFRGSLVGTSLHPSDSVMEYMPFPVTHKLNYIGSKDQKRIDAVYRNAMPIYSLKTCSDVEAKEGNDPNCLQNDLGEPTSWYMKLSNRGDKGVFTTVRENQSSLPERPYLDLLGKFIANPLVAAQQAELVSNYLCRQDNKIEITNYLEIQKKKMLICK